MRCALICLACLSSAAMLGTTAAAQSLSDFQQRDICIVKGGQSVIDPLKVLNIVTTGASASDIDTNQDGTLSREERVQFATRGEDFRVINLITVSNDYYSVRRIGGGQLSAFEFLSNPGAYEAVCKNWPRPTSTGDIQAFRKGVDDATKAAGKSFIVRRDVDNLSLPLSRAQPARLSAARDRVAKNTLMQSEIAVATEFTFHLGEELNPEGVAQGVMPVIARPYVRYVGKFNSNPDLRDVDNLAFGVRADLFGIELPGLLTNKFSLRGEYLTDGNAQSEIAAGELVWNPYFVGALRTYLPIGEEVPVYGGEDGMFIFISVNGRYRFGEVFDAGRATNLLTTEEYGRLGGRGRIEAGFRGSDALSGLSAYVDYLYFDDLQDRTPVDSFFKFEAGLGYAITSNVGVNFAYIKGRDEDKLELLDRVEGNLTIKFGGPEFSFTP